MARTPISAKLDVTASYQTIYTAPAGATALLSTLTAYNSAGGSRTLTVAIVEVDSTQSTTVLGVDTISNGASAAYGASASKPLFPQILNAGAVLQLKGDNTGITCRVSGMEFS